MKEKYNRFLAGDGKRISFLMLVIFALALVFIIVVSVTGDRVPDESKHADLSWNEGWTLSDGTELSMPYKENGDTTIKNTLPEGLTRNDSVVFSSGYQPFAY